MRSPGKPQQKGQLGRVAAEERAVDQSVGDSSGRGLESWQEPGQAEQRTRVGRNNYSLCPVDTSQLPADSGEP